MEFIRSAFKNDPSAQDHTAIRVDKKSYSYSQIFMSAWHISDLLCNIYLKSKNGSSQCAMHPLPRKEGGRGSHLHGARIGIVAKPSAEFVSGLLGTWLGGGVAVPLALSYPEAELLHVMNDSEVSVILSLEDHKEVTRRIADKCAAHFSLIPDISTTASRIGTDDNLGPDCMAESMASKIAEENDPALIVYTSGTTGKPKGVVHTHKSIAAQVQILSQAWEYSSNDQFLHCLPLHHVHGLFNALLAPLYAGAAVEFIPKFSVRGIWQRWRESYADDGSKRDDAITVFTGVPTMYTRLLQGYESMDPGLQSSSAAAARQLRLMMCGSSALPFPVMKQWESITGHRLLERYGMTEFVMAISNPLRGNRKGGTVGKPLPHVQAKILAEEESGNDSEGVGELCIKSPSLFKEYWKRPEVTKESFTDDGFFKTGDTVKMDEDGYYIILGRTSADIMKVGGYKLSALEIESVLLEHTAILECAVLGLPDEDYGEAVCAIIVAQEDAKCIAQKESKPVLRLDEIKTWCKEKLAAHKVPTRLFIWDTLPRNAMGKVNKKELRKLVAV